MVDDEDRYAAGMRVRRAVLGDAHVDAASAQPTEVDAVFQRFITEAAWGAVWARPGLDLRLRSLITIAILAALDREELDLHLRAAPACDVSPEEIAEVLLHVAVYAGVPTANRAFSRLKAIGGESGSEG